MKTRTIFCCEICGNEYDDENEAKRCEESHHVVIEAYRPHFKVAGSKYPEEVELLFSDGYVHRYKLDSVAGRKKSNEESGWKGFLKN